MYRIIRKFLFMFNPERAHHLTMFMLRLPALKGLFTNNKINRHPQLQKRLFGLTFPNPVGLAAGLDKDAIAFDPLGELGFGFVEVGTLTPLAQPGNDKPRLFRLKSDNALINRMGFNNHGAAAAARRLSRRSKNSGLIVGGNIGKNKSTPNEKAVDDYKACFEVLYPYVDYFVVNVSSPNTPNLRELQEKEPLKRLLLSLQDLNSRKPAQKPILLKIAPDLNEKQLDDIIDIVKETRLAGLIATNTTLDRSALGYSAAALEKIGSGGLSGKPLTKKSTEVIRYIKEKSGNAFPVIGVGGIHTAADALEKLEAGADLVQLYTGFIYEGPQLITDINKAILARTKE